MDESILNHLFLPHYLPSSADDDFLIQNNHQNEYKILEFMEQYLISLESTDATSSLPIFQILIGCIRRWSVLQNSQNISVSSLQSAIEQLPSGGFLPLYFHAQNAAILIEMDENNTSEPIISSWQVSLPSSEITSSLVPHLSCFPVRTYRLNNRSQLICKVHCELLMDFMLNTIEHSKSYKASRTVNEIREVPQSHYVCQWWIQQFKQIKVEKNTNTSAQFTKKHRDHIRWNDATLPFRRSGLWMTIKVVFHTILVKRLKHVGTLVYKLLITHFLTYVIYTRKHSPHFKLSIDLLVHCIRKIVRRLNKIEGLLLRIDSNDMMQWIHYTKQEIEMKIDKIFPKIDWQKSIRTSKQMNKKLVMTNLESDHHKICQHLCQELKAYLHEQKSKEPCGRFSDVNNHDNCANVNSINYIPFIEELTKKFDYTIGVALTRVEIWVKYRLKQWINRSSISKKEGNPFEILLRFYEEYQTEALNYYWSEQGPTDPMGYSRFILTSLTIIRFMHEKLCNYPSFERLKSHSIEIPNLLKLFEFLVLPNREEMIGARDLYDYFSQFSCKPYPDLLTNIKSADAFGVHYAAQSSTMNRRIQIIRSQADQDKQMKIKQVEEEKEKYTTLMETIKDYSCKCNGSGYYKCYWCKIQRKANEINIQIYECPLPSHQDSALAVIFELQMPTEIRCYRDILWQFINRPNPNPTLDTYEWLSVPPHAKKLGPFYTGPNNCKVRLVSPTKPITQSHYSTVSIASASASTDSFLFENSLKVQISPKKPIEFEEECRILTPQLDHPDYRQLQFTLESTQFVQNRVIARLSECPPKLNPTQFIEFGSLRSGHRLQWWNLLTIFEMDSLSIAEESVAILIIHSILQYGPCTPNSNTISNDWCPESHEQLLEDHFVDEFISRLNRHLEDCELNWQNELVLLVITMITMRILTICNHTREAKAADLALKCRKTGEKWIDLISESIGMISSSAFNEAELLRLKTINIGVSCLLTFSTQKDRISYLLSLNEHAISLLKAVTTVHDNIILNKNQSNMSNFMRNIMRFSERVSVMIQPTLGKFLQDTSYQSLNEFAATNWSAIKRNGNMNGQWKKRKEDIYDGWYDCQYGSRYISMDCIKGTVLVDGMTISFLPETITSNELFVRVFGYHIFQVQPGKLPNTYITKQLYHGKERVQYKFRFNDRSKHLTINERHIQTNDVYQLIPHNYFEAELPNTFVHNHSHWWNAKDQTVEFRSVHFEHTDFLDNKPYILSLITGHLTTTKTINTQILVNQSSAFFQQLFRKYFIRLDDKPYVYIMRDYTLEAGIFFHIHLSRLGIAFKYNTNGNIIRSREYPNMCVEENQWLGTLTGLESGLLLSPIPVNNKILKCYPYRKLIVPFGQIHGSETDVNHQIVTIERTSQIPYLHQYFVFILNDRLKILQPIDSPAGWLYLALLHAMTSHPLPDEYTGMTGMERAFQLLNSAGCWSDQPFDSLSLIILGQIAAISPKVNYYPEYLTRMEKIDWNTNGVPYSMQHFGYYLIAKQLVKTSQQLSFMYPSSISYKTPEIFESKVYNARLLTKLYWDYRDSYNPIARLCVEIREDTPSSRISYKPTSQHYSQATNYPIVRLVDDLYNKGIINLKDCFEQTWLPLSQWLANENQLRDIWIGLLKIVDCVKKSRTEDSRDGIERLEKLIDFLHYISYKAHTKPFLQMLKTALKMPAMLPKHVKFPPFIKYFNIEEITVVKERIVLSSSYTADERHQILQKVETAWQRNSNYAKKDKLTTPKERTLIDQLLMSWKNNRKLRTFLESIQSYIDSVSIEQFHTKAPYNPQKFTVELFKNHYQIQIKTTERSINQTLLQKAEQKFHHPYSGHFNKPMVDFEVNNRQNEFSNQIFSVINDQENPLGEIGNYFKNQLAVSWEKLLSDEQILREDPTIKEINEFLKYLREESTQSWNELVKSIKESNVQLFETGLVLRITPTTLISYFQRKTEQLDLTTDQPTLLGGILVNWTLEQQLERALLYASHCKREDFEEEISNIPHSNWAPSEHVSWLILELEMNITIREIQIKMARQMMQPTMTTNNDTVKSAVMQMNMGEGKTSVILPMLALSLSSSDSNLVRIVVLKSLFPTNYQSLRYKLGGLFNRRVFPFASRRDINFTGLQINHVFDRLQEALTNRDIILTSPEDIHSFDLLTIDKCRQNKFDTGLSMLTVQRWIKKYVRDILDESDEILHVKYQLVYTVGRQQQLDAGAERWKTIQSILMLVKKHAENISKHFSEEVCYKSPEPKSAFPQFRLQSNHPFSLLCGNIVTDWINTRNYLNAEKQIILSFILETNSSVKDIVDKFPHNDIQLFLLVNGLLSSEVLLFALKKRYRVNYGINLSPSFNSLMAVPFRAKDVVADRTEFGHPDVALVLTQLSYYYSGLNDKQLTQCFNHLNEKETDAASIYNEWILYEQGDVIPNSIRQWKGVNSKDDQQRACYLFPTFRYNMLVINYFLNHFVYPREAKQFPHKLVSSAWDLSSSARSKIITGFSGTNDTQLLLPVHIHQYDLPELQKTDAIVVNNLLQPENQIYHSLPINPTSTEILNEIMKCREMINVILDVGALYIDGTNQDIAVKWLNMSDKNEIDYAVYFDSDSIFVCDRQFYHHRFEASPASERLDHCVFYLDEIHTRGTDFKFPSDFRAAVTLGNGLTKDRFVQACMRMRKLGHGHSLTFWSSHEVHQQITGLKKKPPVKSPKKNFKDRISLIDILRWVYENTVQSTWDGLHHWASQSLSFQRKVVAFQDVHWEDSQQLFTDAMMENLATKCLEPEITELTQTYGVSKTLKTIDEIYFARYQQSNDCLSIEIHNAVLKRLRDYSGKKTRISQLLDEEQQRELEQELEEERHLASVSSVEPCEPKLHNRILRLCDAHDDMMNLSQLPSVFQPLVYAFNGTTFYKDCQPDSWQQNLWVSTEFQRVIQIQRQSLNPYLRPPRWIIVNRNKHIIFISPLEANALIGLLNTQYHKQQPKSGSITTLRLLLPRIKRRQSIFVNTPTLTIPPTIESIDDFFTIPLNWLVQLFIFNGTLYFETSDEQTAYCHCLGLCPGPRTMIEERCFEKGWISVDGFVSNSRHRSHLQIYHAQFNSNPLTFVRQLLENRNHSHAPITSHVGSIILNSFKLL